MAVYAVRLIAGRVSLSLCSCVLAVVHCGRRRVAIMLRYVIGLNSVTASAAYLHKAEVLIIIRATGAHTVWRCRFSVSVASLDHT